MISGETLTLKDTQGKLIHFGKQRRFEFPGTCPLFYHSVHVTETYNAFHSNSTEFHDSDSVDKLLNNAHSFQ